MEIRSKVLVAIYVIIAVLALLLTWYHVPSYLGHGIFEANRLFWQDAIFNTTASGKFLVVDVLFLATACNLFMFLEGRRLGVRFIYFYVLAGILVAISVAFPLFLAARQVALARQSDPNYQIRYLDMVILAILFLTSLTTGLILT